MAGRRREFLTIDDDLLQPERELWAEGFRFISGVDEAGRGPLAGPVVAAAVILPFGSERYPWVFDSKQLSDKEREERFAELTGDPRILYRAVEISASEIDRVNILQATHMAMRQAVFGLPRTEIVLVDGLPVKGFAVPARNLVKGDTRSASIAAASIIAKVIRDRRMLELDEKYPGYGFAANKGYGTAEHLRALRRLGPCPEHRRSFRPVREAIFGVPEQLKLL